MSAGKLTPVLIQKSFDAQKKMKKTNCTETTNTSLDDLTFAPSFLASGLLKNTSGFIRRLAELSIWWVSHRTSSCFKLRGLNLVFRSSPETPETLYITSLLLSWCRWPLPISRKTIQPPKLEHREQSGRNIFLKGVWTGGVQGQALNGGLSIAPGFQARGRYSRRIKVASAAFDPSLSPSK